MCLVFFFSFYKKQQFFLSGSLPQIHLGKWKKTMSKSFVILIDKRTLIFFCDPSKNTFLEPLQFQKNILVQKKDVFLKLNHIFFLITFGEQKQCSMFLGQKCTPGTFHVGRTKGRKLFQKCIWGKGSVKKRAHLVKLVYTIDSKSVPVFPGYRFESDSE